MCSFAENVQWEEEDKEKKTKKQQQKQNNFKEVFGWCPNTTLITTDLYTCEELSTGLQTVAQYKLLQEHFQHIANKLHRMLNYKNQKVITRVITGEMKREVCASLILTFNLC